jgi:hypothetical protein
MLRGGGPGECLGAPSAQPRRPAGRARDARPHYLSKSRIAAADECGQRAAGRRREGSAPRLLLDYNLEIGAVSATSPGKIWRFGIMGLLVQDGERDAVALRARNVFADLGIKIEFGAAEAAAYHAYAAIPNRSSRCAPSRIRLLSEQTVDCPAD